MLKTAPGAERLRRHPQIKSNGIISDTWLLFKLRGMLIPGKNLFQQNIPPRILFFFLSCDPCNFCSPLNCSCAWAPLVPKEAFSQELPEKKCHDKSYTAQTHLKWPASLRLLEMFLNYLSYKALLKEAKHDALSLKSSLDGDVSTLRLIPLVSNNIQKEKHKKIE